jgi:hypothetical protein
MKILIATALTLLALASGHANAGGLFGKGGLIRGDVGKLGDVIIDKPVTPVLRGTVVAGGAVLGGVGGEMLGIPVPIGAAAGAGMGNEINEIFAGRGPWSSPPARPVNVMLGNRCSTGYLVSNPGPLAPLGAPCEFRTGERGWIVR